MWFCKRNKEETEALRKRVESLEDDRSQKYYPLVNKYIGRAVKPETIEVHRVVCAYRVEELLETLEKDYVKAIESYRAKLSRLGQYMIDSFEKVKVLDAYMVEEAREALEEK